MDKNLSLAEQRAARVQDCDPVRLAREHLAARRAAWVGGVLLAMCVGSLMLAGIALKQDRKHQRVIVDPHGCYVWSDGYEQCWRR